jgi:hypothetical protein
LLGKDEAPSALHKATTRKDWSIMTHINPNEKSASVDIDISPDEDTEETLTLSRSRTGQQLAVDVADAGFELSRDSFEEFVTEARKIMGW